MRITNQLFFHNTQTNYQTSMNDLHRTNQQLSSGLKIQHSYQDTGVYVDAMRLDYEVSTLEQVVETSSKAQSFAKNTDKAFNQFTESLDYFKAKLVQAANDGAMSSTSREALANDLEGIKTHLMSVANTSINGTFLFSGSATKVKPISDDGAYNGNDELLKAVVGSEVQLAYNVDGKSLFQGSDGDYHKKVTTNVPMYNQTKLYPSNMSEDSEELPVEEYLKTTDTVRDMVGDTDNTKGDEPDTVFYVSGKNSYGEAINEKIQMTSDSKVSDLLERIGHAYGNTSTRDLVDVSLNSRGQIEIKDLRQGSNQLEFHMFGAVDREAASGVVGNADQTDLENLLTNPNVDIIEFTKSNFKNEPTASSITSREDTVNLGTFKVGSPFKLDNGNEASASTLLKDLLPEEINRIDVGGTPLFITATTNMQDLMSAIENEYESAPGDLSVRIENGQIIAQDNTLGASPAYGASTQVTSAAPITLTGRAAGVVAPAFTLPDGMNFQQRGFEHEGNQLTSNVRQIINETGEYATRSTKLAETSGKIDSATGKPTVDGTTLNLSGKDITGGSFNLAVNLAAGGSTFTVDGVDLDGDTIDDEFDIFNSDGIATPADEVTYQQLMDVVSLVMSNSTNPFSSAHNQAYTDDAGTPQTGNATDGINKYEYNIAIDSARRKVDTRLDKTGQLEIVDKTSSVSPMRLSMYDENADNFGTPSALSFMANDALTIDEPSVNIFRDLDVMIEAVRSGTYRADSEGGNPRNPGIQNGIERLDHILDHFTKEHTKIGALSNALQDSKERAELLAVNVKTVKSEIIDIDYGETLMKFQQMQIAYQAMLSSVSKINGLSLVNYM
jgi:flagellar hook-associated protein 3 FlgL